MPNPDKPTLRIVTDAIARDLRRTYTPDPVPLPDDEDDSGWRAILADFERRFRAAKDEETER